MTGSMNHGIYDGSLLIKFLNVLHKEVEVSLGL